MSKFETIKRTDEQSKQLGLKQNPPKKPKKTRYNTTHNNNTLLYKVQIKPPETRNPEPGTRHAPETTGTREGWTTGDV